MSEKNFPAVPSRVEPQTRNFLSYVRERLVRLLGSGVDRAVTFRDLTDLGLIDRKRAEEQARR